jgi:hypothetical protein
MKKILFYSLIIAFFSSIIFFGVTYFINLNVKLALYKTLIAFFSFSAVNYAVFSVINFMVPGLIFKSKEEKVSIKDVDYVFPDFDNEKK